MVNTQKPEKKTKQAYNLEVHSIFNTVQGEGPYAGEPAVFVRLAGCNLQCPMCDTDYTSGRMTMTDHAILAEINAMRKGSSLVVITGGEPFRQPIGDLVRFLVCVGNLRVQIETNGTLYDENLPYSWEEVTIVCSPKTGRINKNLLPYIDAFKYVLDHKAVDVIDGLPIRALDHPAHPKLARPPKGFQGTVYVQPIDKEDSDEYQKDLHACIKTCMQHGYTLCLQLHKYIGLD